MEFLIPVLIFGGIVALAIIGIASAAYVEKKRREAIQLVADELGLTFHAKGDPAIISGLSTLHLFAKGHSKKITNVIRGETEDVALGIFDYRYTTGSGKNARTSRQTVTHFQSPHLDLPQFALRPQHFFHSISKVFGYQDIDFDSHPVFSKSFILRGDNETRIRELFTPDILAFFEQNQTVCVEGSHGDLIFYRHAKRSKPQQLRDLLDEGFQVFKLFRC